MLVFHHGILGALDICPLATLNLGCPCPLHCSFCERLFTRFFRSLLCSLVVGRQVMVVAVTGLVDGGKVLIFF